MIKGHEATSDGSTPHELVISAPNTQLLATAMDPLSTPEVVALVVEWLCIATVIVLLIRTTMLLGAWIGGRARPERGGEGGAEDDPY